MVASSLFVPLWCCFLAIICVGNVSSVEVYLGGLFGSLTGAGSLDHLEHLAAFLMAINEINNKTDGVYDDLLPSITLSYSVGTSNLLKSSAIRMAEFQGAFSGEGVFAVVNTLPAEAALYVNQMATKLHIPNILSVGNSGLFSSRSDYPYVSKVVALESHQGAIIQNTLCLFAKKITLFIGTDDEDLKLMNEFADEESCDLTILAEVVVRDGATDMTEAIAQAKTAGARYYVILLPAYQTAALLEQGHAAGLFDGYSTITTTDRSCANITQYFSPETDVAEVMTGVFAQHYWSNYYTNRTSAATGFSNRWRNQPSTAGETVNGVTVCNSAKDGDGDTYLYQTITATVTTCTGLDFSKYDAAGFSMRPFTALTYDATVMMAKAVDFAINNNLDFHNAATLQTILVENITHDGASGFIQLSGGTPLYDHDRRGDRATDLEYVITNFNAEVYASGSEDYMVNVAHFNGNTRSIQTCAPVDFVHCFPPIFGVEINGNYFTPPPDSPPAIVMQLGTAMALIIQLLAAVVVVLVLVFGVFTIRHRKKKVIKASQPVLLWCILAGGLMAAARISIGGADKDSHVCKAEFWLGHLAFVLMIASLFVKSYRVHCIVNTTKLTRVTFSGRDAFKMLAAIVTALVVYLVIAMYVGGPTVQYMRVVKSNQETEWLYCGMETPEFQTALFAAEFLLLMVSFRTCWEIRNVPDIVNESKQISTAMSAIVLVCVLIMPLIFFLGLPPYTGEFIASLAFGFGSAATLLLLFVPTVLRVLYINDQKRLSAKVIAAEMIAAGSGRDKDLARQPGKSKNVLDADHLLKNRTREDRMLICKEQLLGWQTRLLEEQRHAVNGSSSGENSTTNGGHHNEHSSSLNASSIEAGGAMGGAGPDQQILFHNGDLECGMYCSRDGNDNHPNHDAEFVIPSSTYAICGAPSESGSTQGITLKSNNANRDLVMQEA
jgi:hypothetical protein